ncbi:MAG: hypothetical protein AAF639_45420 [Chloroflexota bacterium]
MHQTIGTQATLQLLRERQANYQPKPVLKAVYDSSWIDRVLDKSSTQSDTQQVQRISPHSKATTAQNGATIQRTGQSENTTSGPVIQRVEDPHQKTYYDKVFPTLPTLEGSAGNTGSHYDLLKQAVISFNNLTLPSDQDEMIKQIPILLAQAKTYLALTGKKTKSYMGQYTNKFANFFRRDDEQVTYVNKHAQVQNLVYALENPAGPAQIFLMLVHTPILADSLYEEAGSTEHSTRKSQRLDGVNESGKMVSHLLRDSSHENYFFLKSTLGSWKHMSENKNWYKFI